MVEVVFNIKSIVGFKTDKKGIIDVNTTYRDFLLLGRRKVKYRINIVQKFGFL